MAELRIPIVVENKGKKALKDVDKSIKGLTSTFKKLAGAAGIGLSTAAVINFGKEAAKAFIEDEKSARRLAVAVKNLGLGFETPRIERYISELSAMSGVTDDQLRPAMQKLLQTTGSVAKSQELLALALDVSRGSGVEFETVVQDLASAMVGKTRGLAKYNLGLSKAELTTISFTDAQKKLGDTFKGANAAYLETYAGKMSILNVAANEAKETIGKGLVDSLSLLAGDGNSIQPLADSMAEFAQNTSNAIYGIAVLIDKMKGIPGIGSAIKNFKIEMIPIIGGLAGVFKDLSKLGAMNTPGVPLTSTNVLSGDVWAKQNKERIAAEKKALETQKRLAALQTKTFADAKKKLALDKASKTLDLERIGITAALKGKINETDRISLELQLALLDKNDSLATKLSAELETATKRQQTLNAALLATPEAPNPFRNWVPPALQDMYSSLQYFGPQGGLGAGVVAGVNPQINVTVELDGQTVGGAVRDTSINDSLSGSFNTVNRSGFKGAIAI